MEQFPVKTEKSREEVLKPILDKIMTAKEYANIKHESPFEYEISNPAGDKKLSYFGAPHCYEAGNPLFARIESSFKAAQPDIIFIEGMNFHGDPAILAEQIKRATAEQVIERMGESGFTMKLAIDNGIEWQSPEPSDETLYAHLLKRGFKKKEIFSWELMQALAQYSRQEQKKDFPTYADSYIRDFKEATKWKGFDYSLESALKNAEAMAGSTIDPESDTDFDIYIDPIPWEKDIDEQSELNRISEASSLIRDQHIVTSIAESLKTHKRPFIVYGSSHAVMQEPALEKLMKESG